MPQVCLQFVIVVFSDHTHLLFQDICHYTKCCLYLYDSYISKFDFMNYRFANLVVVLGDTLVALNSVQTRDIHVYSLVGGGSN